MESCAFVPIDEAAVFSDLAAVLSRDQETLTEIAFAERGGSKFNEALYATHVTADMLADFASQSCNVAFLGGCDKCRLGEVPKSLTARRAKNSDVLKKWILTFDIDLKDQQNRAISSASQIDLIGSNLVARVRSANIPLWLLCSSGNGLHLHFKLETPLDCTDAGRYSTQYRGWISTFALLFGSEIIFDSSCSNPARLMRLPGSTNWKDAKHPVKCFTLFHNPSADASVFFRGIASPSDQGGKRRHIDGVTLERVLAHFDYKKTDTIRTQGEQTVCSSPFSRDSSPSFYFHPRRQIFYDFSTQQGGGLHHLIALLSGSDPKRDTDKVRTILRKISGQEEARTEQTRFTLRSNGVWFSKSVDDDDHGIWICSPLEVKAMTRDATGSAWGRILDFTDQDAVRKRWSMPMELLAGDGLELRKELLSRGLRISTNRAARALLLEYVQLAESGERVRCIDRIGWHGDTFVLPKTIFRPSGVQEELVLQKDGDFEAFSTSGTLKEWQQEVAAPCRGNSLLVFSLSLAFASPLLALLGEESGGVHLVGPSSIGKTLALRVAGSVWGGGGVNGFLRKWRATVNGLESLAENRCDSLLVLDEIAEISAKDAAQATYMLANGCGKKRLDRNGTPRASAEWRLLFLSSGEIGLGSHLAEAGEAHRGGQFVRLVEIDADAHRGMGIFENIGDACDSRALADRLRANCAKLYGQAIHAFLEQLVTNKTRESMIHDAMALFASSIAPSSYTGQTQRVLKRFGLIAAGGILACRFGILPFEEIEIVEAVRACFLRWVQQHQGHPDFETGKILSQIRQYLQSFGCAQFPEWDGRTSVTFAGRCSGYRLNRGDGVFEWLILNEVFRNEICRGVDFRKVTRVLKAMNLLETDSTGRTSVPMRLPHFGLARVYHLKSHILTHGKPFTGGEQIL